MARWITAAVWSLTMACAAQAASGCEEAREQAREKQRKRGQEKKAHVEKEYERLAFLLAHIGDDPGRKLVSCDDDSLPSKLRRSARMCTRLALVDAAYARRLFGSAQVDEEKLSRWKWMRSRMFEVLQPLTEIDKRLGIQKHDSALKRLDTTFIGVFTSSTAPVSPHPERYQGWLVIIDSKNEKLRCQIDLDLDVEKVFKPPFRQKGFSKFQDSPRSYEEAFMRAVDKSLKRVTDNFCTD